MTGEVIPFRPKTIAEQRVEYFENLRRPLTDAESDELRRSLHAVYCRNLRQRGKSRALELHEREERELLARLEAEALQGERK